MRDKDRKKLEEAAREYASVEPISTQRVTYTPTPPSGPPPEEAEPHRHAERPRRQPHKRKTTQ